MARINTFTNPQLSSQIRTFSEEFRRKKVEEIERRISTVSEISREYQVTKTAIYKWVYKYSRQVKKKERMIVEAESDTRKINELKKQIAELERLVGQKQIQIDFMAKLIDIAEESYQIDIKKKFGGKGSSGSGSIEKS